MARHGEARHGTAAAGSVEGGIFPSGRDRNTTWLWQSDMVGFVRVPIDARFWTGRSVARAIGCVVFIPSPWSKTSSRRHELDAPAGTGARGR